MDDQPKPGETKHDKNHKTQAQNPDIISIAINFSNASGDCAPRQTHNIKGIFLLGMHLLLYDNILTIIDKFSISERFTGARYQMWNLNRWLFSWALRSLQMYLAELTAHLLAWRICLLAFGVAFIILVIVTGS